jgi:hypothetical protein
VVTPFVFAFVWASVFSSALFRSTIVVIYAGVRPIFSNSVGP